MPDVRELSDKALELAGSGQYEKALELVMREIKTDANNARAFSLLLDLCTTKQEIIVAIYN